MSEADTSATATTAQQRRKARAPASWCSFGPPSRFWAVLLASVALCALVPFVLHVVRPSARVDAPAQHAGPPAMLAPPPPVIWQQPLQERDVDRAVAQNRRHPQQHQQPQKAVEDRMRAASQRVTVHASTDKPVYRCGDVVRVRGVCLDAFSRRPMSSDSGACPLSAEVLDASGKVVSTIEGTVDSSVIAATWVVPREAAGGVYTVRLASQRTPAAAAERKFEVRAYRTPRLTVESDLDQHGMYVPGGSGSALVSCRTASGDLCAGAEVTSVVSFPVLGVSEFHAARWTGFLGPAGMGSVPFVVPQDALDDGVLTVTVVHGGVIESKSVTVPVATPESVAISFYPEGGNTVSGIKNRVYFAAKNHHSDPVDIAGVVSAVDLSLDGEKVAVVSTHEGRGFFEYVPKEGVRYQLTLTAPAVGTEFATFKLPDPIPVGVSLRSDLVVHAASGPVEVSVASPVETSLRVALFQRERELSSSNISITQDNLRASVKVSLPAADGVCGVLRVTVFAAKSGLPLAERLVYRAPAKSLDLTVIPDQEIVAPGDLVKLRIHAADHATGNPVVGAVLGITVSDLSVLEMIEKRRRAPRLPEMVLLEDEVGELFDSGSYISADRHGETSSRLDLLLATQGWRMFVYKDIDAFLSAMGSKAERMLAWNKEYSPMMWKGDFAGAGVKHMFAPTAVNDAEVLALEPPEAAAVGLQPPAPEAMPPQLPPAPEPMPQEPPLPPTGRRQGPGDQDLRVDAMRLYAYAPAQGKKSQERQDFVETVLYCAAGTTDNHGDVVTEFHVSDLLTRFLVTVDAFSQDGALGSSSQTTVESRKQFSLSVKAPTFVTVGDRIVLPVSVVNNQKDDVVTALSVSLPDSVKFAMPLPSTFTVPARSSTRQLVTVDVTGPAGRSAEIKVAAATADGKYADSLAVSFAVQEHGFVTDCHAAGVVSSSSNKEWEWEVPQESRNRNASIKLYTSPAASLLQALEALIAEPYGCFEQTSSVTYPMVMALSYFRAHDVPESHPSVARLNQMLAVGYKRLVSYEVAGGGFEWFGSPPAHEALTAYGLLEFTDMAKVFPVASKMVERTKEWLLSRREHSEGTFKRNQKVLDQFGGASEHVTNAYISWALTSAGIREGLDKQVATLLDQCKEGAVGANDAYFLALVSNALYKVGRTSDAQGLASRLVSMVTKDGSVGPADLSVTMSRHHPLEVETTGLAALAWMNFWDTGAFAGDIERAVRWLNAHCKDGKFGSTQGTVLALKAIVAYDSLMASAVKIPYEVVVAVDGSDVTTKAVAPVEKAPQDGLIEITNLPAKAFTPGKHRWQVRVVCKGTTPECSEMKLSLPLTARQSFVTDLPSSAGSPRLSMSLALSSANVHEGDSVQASLTIENLEDVRQGMSVSVIGLPGGLAPRHERLQELVRSHDVDFYEVVGRDIVLYWRSLSPKQRLSLTFDALAEVPGTFYGSASRSYLYYDDAVKTWLPLSLISISPIE